MLLYIMLYIVLAYLMLHTVLACLMLFAALSNAVCLHNASFFANDLCRCFLFSCFVLAYRHIVCLFHGLICIMHNDFNLLVFLNSMFTLLLCSLLKGLCALRRNST